ncbi:DUF4393 domain-containing protein [Pectobacterium brasiliense]|uniref:DUF4393 domain-containing protein n=1 Tax=Pectobacterium brasiliense TaxID=180957 RepID=UPI00196954A5|nr:DUF4393 domain-containing protein [Pectobacterium brasiliense]MBN3207508.1 DUF4393 domain-containing protein [Pectobacterium brasiliense]
MADENTSENDKSSGNNKVAETIKAVTGLTQSIPVYQDLIQPAAQELGKGLAVIAKSVNVALSPLSVMVWGYEKIQDQFMPKVAEKLKNTKPEDIITPKPNVAVPAIEALRYTADDESLSDLFAGLLASAMDKNKSSKAHPAFVEIIKQLTADEAKIITVIKDKRGIPLIDVVVFNHEAQSESFVYSNLSSFSFGEMLEQPQQFSSYVYNLCRLGLLEIPKEYVYLDSNAYDVIINSGFWKRVSSAVELKENQTFHYEKKILTVTDMGRQFISVCIS